MEVLTLSLEDAPVGPISRKTNTLALTQPQNRLIYRLECCTGTFKASWVSRSIVTVPGEEAFEVSASCFLSVATAALSKAQKTTYFLFLRQPEPHLHWSVLQASPDALFAFFRETWS